MAAIVSADDVELAGKIATAAAQGVAPHVYMTWLPKGQTEAIRKRRWLIIRWAMHILEQVQVQLGAKE